MNIDWRVLLTLLLFAGAWWLYDIYRNEKKVHDLEEEDDTHDK